MVIINRMGHAHATKIMVGQIVLNVIFPFVNDYKKYKYTVLSYQHHLFHLETG